MFVAVQERLARQLPDLYRRWEAAQNHSRGMPGPEAGSRSAKMQSGCAVLPPRVMWPLLLLPRPAGGKDEEDPAEIVGRCWGKHVQATTKVMLLLMMIGAVMVTSGFSYRRSSPGSSGGSSSSVTSQLLPLFFWLCFWSLFFLNGVVVRPRHRHYSRRFIETVATLITIGLLRLKACLVAEDAERQLRAAVDYHLKARVPKALRHSGRRP